MPISALRAIAALLCAGALQSAYAQTALELATELVEAARFDYTALLGVQVAAEREQAAGKATAENVQCVQRATSAPFTPVLSRYFAEQMTPAELKTAIDFYGTSLGRKFVAHGIYQSQKQYGLKPDTGQQRFSPQDVTALQTFSKSPAGKKLLEQNLDRNAVLSPESRAVAHGFLQACGMRR